MKPRWALVALILAAALAGCHGPVDELVDGEYGAPEEKTRAPFGTRDFPLNGTASGVPPYVTPPRGVPVFPAHDEETPGAAIQIVAADWNATTTGTMTLRTRFHDPSGTFLVDAREGCARTRLWVELGAERLEVPADDIDRFLCPDASVVTNGTLVDGAVEGERFSIDFAVSSAPWSASTAGLAHTLRAVFDAGWTLWNASGSARFVLWDGAMMPRFDITLDRDAYAPGESITGNATLQNGAPFAFRYTSHWGCHAIALELRAGDGTLVDIDARHHPPDSFCSHAFTEHRLEPGAEWRFPFTLAGATGPGVYVVGVPRPNQANWDPGASVSLQVVEPPSD